MLLKTGATIGKMEDPRPISSSMSKNKLLSIRIDTDLKKKAKKVAAADGRSLSNWVTRLIQREIEKSEKKER